MKNEVNFNKEASIQIVDKKDGFVKTSYTAIAGGLPVVAIAGSVQKPVYVKFEADSQEKLIVQILNNALASVLISINPKNWQSDLEKYINKFNLKK